MYLPFGKKSLKDTKGAIRIRISKNRQYNGQKKKYKRTNNDLQNKHKTKDRVTRTLLKQGVNSGARPFLLLFISWHSRFNSNIVESGIKDPYSNPGNRLGVFKLFVCVPNCN